MNVFMVQDADSHSIELSCRKVAGIVEVRLTDSQNELEPKIWLAREDARGLANFINQELA